jgi:rSAM/selenodomain-associated transferase 1
MTEHVLARLSKVKRMGHISMQVCYTGASRRLVQEWLGTKASLRRQVGSDLGARLAAAFRWAFHAGMERVIVVGSDAPGITASSVESALDALKNNPLVLGPAEDGGYYLIGLSRMLPELFVNIPWGTGLVLGRTLDTAAKLGILRPIMLAPLGDVDRPEDLKLWEHSQGSDD